MNKFKKAEKDYWRYKTLFALNAANYYNQAVLSSRCVKPSTLEEATRTASLIKLLCKEDVNPLSLIKSEEETTNEAINKFHKYANIVKLYPFDSRPLESFCRYYAHTGWEVSLLKCNINYIIYGSTVVRQHQIGEITKSEMDQSLNAVIQGCKRFFPFNKRIVFESLLQAISKFQEIENKVLSRKAKTHDV